MTREEAIEVYNGLINTKIKEAFEFFAPELRDSEDEKIRKALVIMIKVPRKEIFEAQGITKEQALAYLERQKEPIDPFDTKLFQDGVKEGRRLEREDIKKEQKSVEWSEEEEKIRKTLLDYYEEALDNYTCVEWLNGITYGELCDWLKSLRPQPNTVSIKDATKFGNLEYERGVKDGLNLHWKPSEEQMQYLLAVINDPNNAGAESCHLILESLYNNLKKLI